MVLRRAHDLTYILEVKGTRVEVKQLRGQTLLGENRLVRSGGSRWRERRSSVSTVKMNPGGFAAGVNVA